MNSNRAKLTELSPKNSLDGKEQPLERGKFVKFLLSKYYSKHVQIFLKSRARLFIPMPIRMFHPLRNGNIFA